MKKLLVALSLGLIASSLHAQITVGHPDFEPFADATSSSNGTSYAVGANLIGQTNAQGLTWAAAGTGSAQATITSGTLTVPGLLADSGNSVSFGSASGPTPRFGLGGAIAPTSPKTVYYSMAFEITSLTGLTSSGAFVAGFNNSTGAQTTQPGTVGARLYVRLASGGYNLGINKADGTAADISWEPATYAVGTTYFVVASYTFSGTPTANTDSAALWVNPSSSSFGAASAPTADLTTSAGANMGTTATADQIASFLLRQGSTTEPQTMIVDEISIGLDWADVTPIPPVSKVTPSFSNLTASPSTTYGTSVTLSGTLSATGPVYPVMGETITVTVNGNAQTTTINDATGDFSISYNPGTAPVSGSPYTITYSYAGDTALNSATDTSTSLALTQRVATLGGSRLYDGTATADSSILFVANLVGSDVVTVASGSGTLAGSSAGAEAISSLGTLTLGGAAVANYTLVGATGSVTITVPPFTAGHPIFEPFADATASNGTSYAVGTNLIGQTNAQGLVWFAAGSGTGQPVIASGALSVPGLLPDSGNSITFSGAAGTSARLDFGTVSTNSVLVGSNSLTVYYSMAFQVNSLGLLSSTPAIVAGFNNAAGMQTNQPTVIGARLYARLSGLGYNLGIDKADSVAGDISWEPATYTVGTTYFVVAGYTFSGPANAGTDSASLWVNPSSSTFGAASAPAADLTTSAGPNLGSSSSSDVISSFLLREASTAQPGTMTVDELSIGLSWADVTPVAATTVTPVITGITASGGNVMVNFTGSSSDAPSAFTLVGSSTVVPLSAYATVTGAVITQLSPGVFQATAATNGSNQFFKIKR